MDEATRRWEAGALAALRGEFKPKVRPGSSGWIAAKALTLKTERGREQSRLRALWLEHRASELQAEAVAKEEIGDHVVADALMDEAEAHRLSAKAIRRELLGEED